MDNRESDRTSRDEKYPYYDSLKKRVLSPTMQVPVRSRKRVVPLGSDDQWKNNRPSGLLSGE